MDIDPDEIGLKVGLEIHQQLATPTKLYCSCPLVKSEEFPYSFRRYLRPAQSEVGRVDPAAVFEFSKGRANVYLWSPESSCLVEADEEPPHAMSGEAVDSTLLIAELMGSSVVDEIHVMRKIVIDGSNTPGFQRTAVIGLGGSVQVDGEKVGVQSVTLEEDAARILGEDDSSRRFALDRLGVPLVEVALDPFTGTPAEVGKLALQIGRTLRSTGRVARGLGTIRQDLNVSVMGGNVVEVKGVQQLNLLSKVVEYEAARQVGLVKIAERIREKGTAPRGCEVRTVSQLLAKTSSRILQRALAEGGKVVCIRVPQLGGLLGWEPCPGVRLGKEVAEVARANSLGGIIHSDEFRRQGITESEEVLLRKECGSEEKDALILLAGTPERVGKALPPVVARVEAAGNGVPAETRGATEDGETRYLRPRPGAQRMYPETDIPDIVVTSGRLKKIAESLPEPWEKRVSRYEKEYTLSRDLALRLYDSDYSPLFERLVKKVNLSPSIVASILVDLPPRLTREGAEEGMVGEDLLEDVVNAINSGMVAKEMAFEMALLVAQGKAKDVEQAITDSGIRPMTTAELEALIDKVLAESKLPKDKGEAAFSPLMGEVMAAARGRADGRLVSSILRQKLKAAARKK